MKNKHIVSLIVTTCSAIAIGLANRAPILSMATCSHSGNHYYPSINSSGVVCNEYWVCCNCYEKFETKPSTGTWVDARHNINDSIFNDILNDTNDFRNGSPTHLGLASGYGVGMYCTNASNAGSGHYLPYVSYPDSYGIGSYLVIDFTGKNMPMISFFSKNYNSSPFYEGNSKQGILICDGITNNVGAIVSEDAISNRVNVIGPYMVSDFGSDGENIRSSFDKGEYESGIKTKVDGKKYRLVIGFSSLTSDSKLNLQYCLINRTTKEVIRKTTHTTNSFSQYNLSSSYYSGSIVVYSRFGLDTPIDKFYPIVTGKTFEEAINTYEMKMDFPDYSGFDDKFTTYGYAGGWSSGSVNDSTIQQYKDAGLNLYFPQGSVDVSNVTSLTNTINIAKSKGLQTILRDPDIQWITTTPRYTHICSNNHTWENSSATVSSCPTCSSTNVISTRNGYLYRDGLVGSGPEYRYQTQTEMDNFIKYCMDKYAYIDGVYGVMLGDEPGYECVKAYAQVYKTIKRLYPHLSVHYNLNPLNPYCLDYGYYPVVGSYNSINQSDASDDELNVRYKKYLEMFLDEMGVDYLQYDDYPMMKSSILNTYFRGLQIASELCKERNIRFDIITQSYADSQRRVLNTNTIEWLNNTILSFGVKNIAYYTYWTKAEYTDNGSFINKDGSTSNLYNAFQSIISYNQSFAPTIKHFNYKGCKFYKHSSINTKTNSYANLVDNTYTFNALINLTSSSYNHKLVTELYDTDNEYYMYCIMNVADPDNASSSTYKQNITLTFESQYNKALVFKQDHTFEYINLSNNQYNISNLSQGYAFYIIPYGEI